MRPALRVGEDHEPPEIIENGTDAGEFPVEHGRKALTVVEKVRPLKVAVRQTDARGGRDTCEKLVAQRGCRPDQLRVSGTLPEPIPVRHCL